MKLTVRDISQFPRLDKLVLIAGREGLSNKVDHCGILDYEYDKDMANKYYDYNYQVDGGFLTLTTFLYAKNNPNLIYDAVKKLVSKNGSGLIIKNIFKLPISDAVIRYADHMNFPIFVLNDSYPFFEDIIVMINKAMEKYDSFYYREQQVNLLLNTAPGDMASQSKYLYEIQPSLQDDFLVVRFRYNRGLFGTELYLEKERLLEASNLFGPEDGAFYYKNGFLLILSREHFDGQPVENILRPYYHMFGTGFVEGFDIGISRLHHFKEELRAAILESLYASLFHDETPEFYCTYDSLGSYQAVLQSIENQEVRRYSQSYTAPLAEHDAEKNGEILDTAIAFVRCGGDLDKTATKMNQHKNTIRYRMKKAGEILGLNPFALGDYEKLALAIRIHICLEERRDLSRG